MIHSLSTPAKSSAGSGAGCPFARTAKMLGIQPESHEAKSAYAASPYHSSSHASGSKPRAYVQAKQQQSARTNPTAPQPLSASLAAGTVAAHRAIERSEGVKAMMASVKRRKVGSDAGSEATTGADADGPAVDMQRLDYVRWLIMLACLYNALESPLHHYQSTDDSTTTSLLPPPQLRPLLAQGLLARIARADSLTADIAAHLESLELESGLSTSDQILEAREARGTDLPSASLFGSLLHAFIVHSPTRDPALLHLLTPKQCHATRLYVDRLQNIANLDSALLVAHAYTRYMGDLSGGQFIKRHVLSRWPLDDEATVGTNGFTFYEFETPDQIKVQLRSAIDLGLEQAVALYGDDARVALTDAVVEEANAAFILNGALFDALIDGNTDFEVTLPPFPKTRTKTSDTVATGQPLLTQLLSLIVVLLAILSSSSTQQHQTAHDASTVSAHDARNYIPLQVLESVVEISNASLVTSSGSGSASGVQRGAVGHLLGVAAPVSSFKHAT